MIARTSAVYRTLSRWTRKHLETHHSEIAVKSKDAKNPEALHRGRTKGIMITDGVI